MNNFDKNNSYPTGSTCKASQEKDIVFIIRAFRHRNYRLFFLGQFISLCGTWMQTVALPWLAYKISGSAFVLGLVAFSSQIPILIFTPLGGAIADRMPKRKILFATQISAMFFSILLAVFAFSGHIELWHIVSLTFLLGAVHSFDMPTRHSFVIEMVGKDDLLNAIALNSSMFNAARVIGPSIAGIVVAKYGEAWCFLLNGLSFGAMILALIHMKLNNEAKNETSESALSSIVGGFKYSWNTLPIRNALILVAIVSLFGMPYAVLLPVHVDKILKAGAGSLGIMVSCAGVGAFIGALVLAAKRQLDGIERWILLSTAGFGLSLIAFSFSRNLYLSAAILLPTGFFMVGQMAASNTLLQSLSSDEFRGRVMSAYSMMFLGMTPFGSLLTGTLAQKFGTSATVALCGLICAIIPALFFFSSFSCERVYLACNKTNE